MEIGVVLYFFKTVVFMEGKRRKGFPLARRAKKETVRVEMAIEIKRMGPRGQTSHALKFMHSRHHGKKEVVRYVTMKIFLEIHLVIY